MDSLIGSFDPQVVLGVAAIAVSVLLVMLIVRILKASAGLILTLLTIVLILQYLFGISPTQLQGAIANLPQEVIQLVQSVDLSGLNSLISG
jgi:hypothetical protein